jgi:GTP-binding protein EngB required for normal cell division
LYVVDAPGYGAHAVATARERREWTTLCADYARTRATLAAAVVVVDATRGVSTEDRRWLDLLSPCIVALSKCDLLKGPGAVARCARLVEDDTHCDVVATCGTTGAGVAELWARLKGLCAAVSVRPPDPRAVAVHRSAV